jgi:hydrogenase expression/formation protein HypC
LCLAIPGKILELSPEGQPTALVDVVGVRRTVDLSLLQDEGPQPGDWVLIHAGFALSKINEEDAEEQMRMFMLLGEDKAALEPVRGYGLDQKNPEDAPQNS